MSITYQRDLTDAENDCLYTYARCPFCGSEDFFEGPQALETTFNWYCANDRCLAGFNLPLPIIGHGALIRESYKIMDGGTPSLNGPRMPESDLRLLFKRRTKLRPWLEMMRAWPNRS